MKPSWVRRWIRNRPARIEARQQSRLGDMVRRVYRVPAAAIDRRVRFDGAPGRIVGFDLDPTGGARILVRLDKTGEVLRVHPTWRVDYGIDAADGGRRG